MAQKELSWPLDIKRANGFDCKYLIADDVSGWHGSVFDHPDYEYTCSKTGNEVSPRLRCRACDEYEEKD